MSQNKSKQIAKNTIMLYLRMLFVMVVGLYSSRVILDTLGVQDFGIYNVVGGVVAIFAFLNSSLSGATSRFLTFELGKDENDLPRVFSTLLTIHIGVAILILVLAETVGIWFLEYKLVIPGERMYAARFVFQLSILSCILQVIQIPYNASIISHEKMKVYAYVGIIEAILKLVIIYLLSIGNFDKLILYSILVFVVSLIVATIYRIYCTVNFFECKYKFIYDKQLIKPMLAFSGWDLYGNLSWMLSTQGVNVLLNLFFGAAINAASGIANQVRNTVSGFSNNVITAIKPQIVKNYASGNIGQMIELMVNASKYSFLLLFFISLPLIIENEFVLGLWLKKVPDFTVVFCQLNLVYSLINALFYPVIVAIHATAKIKEGSFLTGTIYLITLPITYVVLRIGNSPTIAFVIGIVILIVACMVNLLILRKHIREFLIFEFLKNAIFTSGVISLIASITPILIHFYMPFGWLRFFLVGFVSVLTVGVSTYFLAFDAKTKEMINLKFSSIIKSK